MAYDFPSGVVPGTIYSGANGGTYIWDGEKWLITSQHIVAAPPAIETPLMDGVADVGDSHRFSREDHVHPRDSTKLSTSGGQTITGGFSFQPFALPAGNITVNALLGNYQWRANNGAFTITAPAIDSAVDILITNTATAGGITFTGFTVGNNTGDLLTATNGASFIISIRRINGISTYVIKALQ